jgi:hypothetical protein
VALDTEIAPSPLTWPEGGLPRAPRTTIRYWAAVFGLWVIGVPAAVGVTVTLLISMLFPIPALWRTGLHGLALECFLLVPFYVAVAVHELGHAIAGHLLGFNVLSMSVGPLIIDRRGLRLASTTSLLGGRAVAGLERWEGDSIFRRQYAWFVAAGPGASLLAGIAGCATALLLVRHADAPWSQHLMATLWLGALISIAVGFFALVPMRSSIGLTSDGEKLRRLRQSPRQAIVALQMAAFTQRPRDWDAALLTRVREDIDHDDPSAVDGALQLSYHYLDLEDPHRAREMIQQAIDIACATARTERGSRRLGPSIGIRLATEAALFEAAWRGDFKAAGQWLARTPPTPATTPIRYRLRSAFAAAAKGRGDPSAPLRDFTTRLSRAGLPSFQLVRATTIDRLAAHAA